MSLAKKMFPDGRKNRSIYSPLAKKEIRKVGYPFPAEQVLTLIKHIAQERMHTLPAKVSHDNFHVMGELGMDGDCRRSLSDRNCWCQLGKSETCQRKAS